MSVDAKLLLGFREALEEGGLSRAMRFLNQSVAYRFSAVHCVKTDQWIKTGLGFYLYSRRAAEQTSTFLARNY
jgi:hypothetical protein